MSDVFISYSRVDKAFVRQLHEALAAQNRDTWVDWEDIEYAEDWWQKICAGIEGADNFIFVITPDSVRSKVCFDEVDYAAKNNKRIIPILRADVTEKADMQRMHPLISKHNWLPFHDTNAFDKSFADLLKTVDIEPAHVKSHTRLLVRAREWVDGGRPPSLLLRGDDLRAAEAWLTAGVNKQPTPTDLHAEYIAASRRAERGRTRLLLGGVSVAFVVSILLAIAAVGSQQHALAETDRANANAATSDANVLLAQHSAATAVYNEGVSRSIALAAQAQLELSGAYSERAPILALQALEHFPYAYQAERALGQVIYASHVRFILPMGTDDWANDAAWSPDGSKLVTVSSGVNIWDGMTGRNLQSLTLSGGAEIKWSPDGSHFLTADYEAGARVWDVETGANQLTLTDGTGSVRSVAWSPDSARIVTANQDGIAKVWDATTGELLETYSGHQAEIWSVDWSPDGTRITSSSLDGLTLVWDAETGETLFTLQDTEGGPPPFAYADWSPSGSYIATAFGNLLTIWNASDGEIIRRLFGHEGAIRTVQWSPDETKLVSASNDNTVRIWDATTGLELYRYTGQLQLMSKAVWSPDGKRIAVLGGVKALHSNLDGDLRVLNVLPEAEGPTLQGFSLAEWSSDGKRILTDGLDGLWHIWDAETGDEQLSGGNVSNPGAIQAAWSPDGKKIAVGGRDLVMRILDSITGREERAYTVQDGSSYFSTIAWLPDGQHVAFNGSGGMLWLWDITANANPIALRHSNEIYDWSPDGSQILIFDNGLSIRDLKTGDEMGTIKLDNTEIISAAWSHDGKRIATGELSGTVRIWDAVTLQEQIKLLGHAEEIDALDWSPNDERLVTAGLDATVRIWDVASGAELLNLTGHKSFVSDVSWSPDGKHLTSTSLDGITQVWRVWQTTDDLTAYAKECCAVRDLTDDEQAQFGLIGAAVTPTAPA